MPSVKPAENLCRKDVERRMHVTKDGLMHVTKWIPYALTTGLDASTSAAYPWRLESMASRSIFVTPDEVKSLSATRASLPDKATPL